MMQGLRLQASGVIAVAVRAGAVFALVLASCASTDDESGRPPVSYGSGGSGAIASGGVGGSAAGGSGGTAAVGGGAVGGTSGLGGSSGKGGSTSSGGSSSGSGGSSSGSGGSGGSTGGSGGSTSGSGGSGGSGGSAGTGGSIDCSSMDAGSSSDSGLAGAGGVSGAAGAAGGAGAAGAPGASCPGFAFCDDFEDGDTVGWTTSGGSWSVLTDGSMVYAGGGATAFSVVGSPCWTDQTVQARVKILQFGGSGSSYLAGLVARYRGSPTYYTFALDAAGDFRLFRGTGSPSGSSGTCDSVPSQLSTLTNTWLDFKMQVSGPAGNVQITTWLGSTIIHTCHTTSNTLAVGGAGVMTFGGGTRAEFDDFKVSLP